MGHRFLMRKILLIVCAAFACGVPVFAQMGGGNFGSGMMDQLFSGNLVFSATMQTAVSGPSGPMSVKCHLSYDHGNSRSEMNMADVQSTSLPPNAAAQLKAIGMDEVVTITRPAATNIITLYPNLRSYFSMPLPASGGSTGKYNVQTSRLGTETVNGHSCIKNKVVVTVNGQSHEFTTWNATDLNNFPVQIAISEQGVSALMSFQNVSFNSINAGMFQPPSGYTRYDSGQELMQSAAMIRGGSGLPPGQ
jgi:hypothetical protein